MTLKQIPFYSFELQLSLMYFISKKQEDKTAKHQDTSTTWNISEIWVWICIHSSLLSPCWTHSSFSVSLQCLPSSPSSSLYDLCLQSGSFSLNKSHFIITLIKSTNRPTRGSTKTKAAFCLHLLCKWAKSRNNFTKTETHLRGRFD